MTILASRAEVLEMIQKPEFFEALFIDTADQFSEKSRAFQNQFNEYYQSQWADPDVDQAQGLEIFRTTKKQIGDKPCFGTWIEVTKLFGTPECPYRVSICEYAPLGVEIDCGFVEDFATMGEALDHAFNIQEQCRIDLYGGLFIQPEIASPKLDALSPEARQVNEKLKTLPQRKVAFENAERQRLEREDQIKNLVWGSSIKPKDAELILKECLKTLTINQDDFDDLYAMSSSINRHLFASKGRLLSYRCEDVEDHGLERLGTVLVALNREPSGHVYFSPNGDIYQDAEQARSSVISKFTEQGSSHHVNDKFYWIEHKGEMAEIDLQKLSMEELQPVHIDYDEEEFERDWGTPSKKWEIDQAMMHAVQPYREALQKKVEAEFQRKDDRVQARSRHTSISM